MTLGAQEVQNVFEEKEPSRRESRVHNTVEHRVDGVAAYNDDDEDADPLQGLLDEGRNECRAECLRTLEVADCGGNVLAQCRIHDHRRQCCHAPAPQKHRKLRRPRFWLPAIDPLEEADDDHEGDQGQQRRLHEGGHA